MVKWYSIPTMCMVSFSDCGMADLVEVDCLDEASGVKHWHVSLQLKSASAAAAGSGQLGVL